METKKQKRAVGKPFVKGDPRINRSGRSKSIDDLRKLAQSIGDEMVTTEEGERMSLAEVILRSWAKSKEPMLQKAFMEYGYGKPPDKLETNPLEPNTTLIFCIMVTNGSDCFWTGMATTSARRRQIASEKISVSLG